MLTMIRQVNLAKLGGWLCELTQEVNLSKVSWKMHAQLTLRISQVNFKVNFNLCMEKPALNQFQSAVYECSW